MCVIILNKFGGIMKKYLLIIFLIMLLTGCKKNNKVVCELEKNENGLNSSVKVTLINKKDTVEKEILYAEYKFESEKEASNNYTKIQDVLEQESSLKVRQNKDTIIAEGNKEYKDIQYDKNTKIEYYEKLGYSCK